MMNSIKNVAVAEAFKDFKTGNEEGGRHFSCNELKCRAPFRGATLVFRLRMLSFLLFFRKIL